MVVRPRTHQDTRTSTVLIALTCLVAGLIIAFSLTRERSVGELTFSPRAFDFLAFRMRVEDHAEGDFRMALDVEWRGRNDWTEWYIRRDGAARFETKVVQGQEVSLYGMGPTHTYSVSDDAVHVPGFWFRDVVATLPGPREIRTQNGSVITIRRVNEDDVQEWDGDSATGIPLGYRQIVDGRVVREFRVVSVVLANGTALR